MTTLLATPFCASWPSIAWQRHPSLLTVLICLRLVLFPRIKTTLKLIKLIKRTFTFLRRIVPPVSQQHTFSARSYLKTLNVWRHHDERYTLVISRGPSSSCVRIDKNLKYYHETIIVIATAYCTWSRSDLSDTGCMFVLSAWLPASNNRCFVAKSLNRSSGDYYFNPKRS